MKTKFEKNIKEKLDSFEPKGVQSQWASLEKQLPKKGLSVLQKGLIFAGAAFVATVVIVFINNYNKTAEIAPEIITENTIDNQKQLVEDYSQTLENIADENLSSDLSENADVKELPVTQNQNIEIAQNSVQDIGSEQVENSVEEVSAASVESAPIVIDRDFDELENENNIVEKVLSISLDKKAGCVPLTVKFSCNADFDDYEFLWHFKDGEKSTKASPMHEYTELGEYTPVLILTPKNKDLSRQRLVGSKINAYGIPEVKIDVENSENVYTFNAINRADIIYSWIIDKQEFNTSSVQYEFKYDSIYVVALNMKDQHGCESRLVEKLNVKIEHNYEMPNAFTPDGLGVNAYFGPVYDDMQGLNFTMLISDKFNQIIYETNDIDSPWDGRNFRTNQAAEAGVYLWKVVTEDQFGNVRTRHGQVTLLRD